MRGKWILRSVLAVLLLGLTVGRAAPWTDIGVQGSAAPTTWI